MRLVVVRHGTAKSKHAWEGFDQDRPLTATGLKQAKAVSNRLARYQPDRVISSPSLRCIETVAPLAALRGLPVERKGVLGIDDPRAAVDFVRHLLLSQPEASTVVICTHREVIVEVVPSVALQFGVLVPHRPPGAKGACWLLSVRGSRATQIRYWRPPA